MSFLEKHSIESASPWTERELFSLALQLGAADVKGWSTEEKTLAKNVVPIDRKVVAAIRERIRAGEDPLGELFAELRTPEVRRDLGATYTPAPIVRAMLAWAQEQATPGRVVDPGAGSGRFLLDAAACFKKANLVGIEIDPLAAAMARGNLAASGLAARSQIILGDYRDGSLPTTTEKTLFIGNPPYVRHHLIGAKWKAWLARKAIELGHEASQLAGLHVYFFLATALAARPGDFGALITAAEWLDVNYGKVVRDLFMGQLGGQGIVVIEPTAAPFPDAATTAAITFFNIESKPASVRLRRVKKLKDLKDLSGGRLVHRERLEAESRWSRLTYGARECPSGYVELGELCRVHRGQVTGANRIWIAGEQTGLPERVLFRSVTKARELISAGKVLDDASQLRFVVDLPEDIDEFVGAERKAIDSFLRGAKKLGVHSGYIASHRRAWWSVGLRKPAPILATYMARRAPVFTRNLASARHINIAHGLYPREPLSDATLGALVDYLTTGISVIDGRTYAGGLTKFEPGEMERLFVPGPEMLMASEGAKRQ